MAGIGIQLRRLTQNESLWGVFRANLYSSILSSGSWVISITVLLLIYFFLTYQFGITAFSIQFLVAVTYLASFSLITSGIFQHIIVRYMADRLFDKTPYKIAGFLFSICLVLIVVSLLFALVAVYFLLPEEPIIVKVLMVSTFVTMNLQWIFSNALAGLKEYRLIVMSFFISYITILAFALWLYPERLTGLLISYYVGQVLLMMLFWVHFLRAYPTNRLFNSDWINFCKFRKVLLLSGVMMHLSFWIDKYLFWFSAKTGMPVLGHLRASYIYDLPMFIAFISMLPGLSVFFYEIEANFSRYYHRYYDAIRDGATIDEIEAKHEEQVSMAHDAMLNALKVQGMICLMLIVFSPDIVNCLHLSPLSVYLLRINFLSAFHVALIIGLINLLYYLDKNHYVAYLTTFFFIMNLILTWISLFLEPSWYGYGFLFSSFLTVILGILLLNKAFSRQTYEAFMFN
ncbi:exopolysaccharide Pel transporter PelG [Legionella waltersii]|uniref:Histidine kinase n=1 Tax=Legionella waltersii TaxID=66969 RepID=A0A0W1A4M9_9GAMM|nr:exopolysaccharide Pel transporter PelG [Legionella waltersii]KTD76287.1 hypothetical protein Lwal_2009 [Legionella waltersii]SNV13437.1 Predicted membrane protein [Legionella waltersii]